MAEQDHQEVVDYCGSEKIVNKGSFILQRQQVMYNHQKTLKLT